MIELFGKDCVTTSRQDESTGLIYTDTEFKDSRFSKRNAGVIAGKPVSSILINTALRQSLLGAYVLQEIINKVNTTNIIDNTRELNLLKIAKEFADTLNELYYITESVPQTVTVSKCDISKKATYIYPGGTQVINDRMNSVSTKHTQAETYFPTSSYPSNTNCKASLNYETTASGSNTINTAFNTIREQLNTLGEDIKNNYGE